MSYPADSETVRSGRKHDYMNADKITVITEKYNIPCPTCGTSCDAVYTSVTQGRSGGVNAEYTPITNINIEDISYAN